MTTEPFRRPSSWFDRLPQGGKIGVLVAGGLGLTMAVCCCGSLALGAVDGDDAGGTPSRSAAVPTVSTTAASVPADPTSVVPTTSSPAPESSAPAPSVPTSVAPPPIVPTVEPAEPTSRPTGGSVYYKNCDAARAAGAAPLYRGDPGYRSALDRDGDGVACES